MSEEQHDDPLDTLFVTEKLDKHLLANVIKPYVQLHISGDILLQSQWESLNLQRKILVYLLARKALSEKGIKKEGELVSDRVTPKEIEADTGIKNNSLRPTLSNLLNGRLVRKDDINEGVVYYIENHMLSRVAEFMTD